MVTRTVYCGTFRNSAFRGGQVEANPVYMSSGYGTDGSGNAYMSGQTIVPYRIHNSVQVTPFYNWNNQLIGANWYASLTMEDSLNNGDTITQEMRDLAVNQMNIHSHHRIIQINFVEGDEYGYYQIDSIAEIILDGNVGANIYTYSGGGGNHGLRSRKCLCVLFRLWLPKSCHRLRRILL